MKRVDKMTKLKRGKMVNAVPDDVQAESERSEVAQENADQDLKNVLNQNDIRRGPKFFDIVQFSDQANFESRNPNLFQKIQEVHDVWNSKKEQDRPVTEP